MDAGTGSKVVIAGDGQLDVGLPMAKYRNGQHIHKKGYPRMSAGPLRHQLLHRLIAAAMIGRDLKKDESVHHKDGNRLNCHWSNLIIMGFKDHGWVSSKQEWYMREKDRREKLQWDEYMAEKDAEFRDEVSAAKAEGVPWQNTHIDGEMQQEWEARINVDASGSGD